jgi:hypothetical protein
MNFRNIINVVEISWSPISKTTSVRSNGYAVRVIVVLALPLPYLAAYLSTGTNLLLFGRPWRYLSADWLRLRVTFLVLTLHLEQPSTLIILPPPTITIKMVTRHRASLLYILPDDERVTKFCGSYYLRAVGTLLLCLLHFLAYLSCLED